MRLNAGWRLAMVGLLAPAGAGAFGSRVAEACSPGMPPATAALPEAGAAKVSTATSLIVFSAAQPPGLTLLANGQNVPLSAAINLGNGVMGSGSTGVFWQLRAATADGMLIGSAEHVLSQAKSDGTTAELTRFTTAASYDKAPGVAPVVRGVRLWRVRYPVADINAGGCVFAEYHGFITVDYDPGTVPNTPAASVVQIFQLAPKNGGSAQRFVYTGATPFAGHAPTEDYPRPTWNWHPELDPTRQYCLGVSAVGDGDIARLPLGSETVCADVVQLSAGGAPPPPVIGGGGSTTVRAGGGCAVAGAASSALAVWLLLVGVILGARRRGCSRGLAASIACAAIGSPASAPRDRARCALPLPLACGERRALRYPHSTKK
jgi:hypothetical protein